MILKYYIAVYTDVLGSKKMILSYVLNPSNQEAAI